MTETNFNRLIAARVNVEAVRAAYETDTVTLDLLLDAQRRLAVATSDYFRSLVDYNLAIRTVHYRKGSLLEYNNVYLAEGPWPGKAYFDARKRARERDAGLQINYGFIQPNVFSRGPVNQKMGNGDMNYQGDGQRYAAEAGARIGTDAAGRPGRMPGRGGYDASCRRPVRVSWGAAACRVRRFRPPPRRPRQQPPTIVSYDWGAAGSRPIPAPSAVVSTGNTRRSGVTRHANGVHCPAAVPNPR